MVIAHLTQKEILLNEAQEAVSETARRIMHEIPLCERSVENALADLRRNSSPQSTVVAQRLLAIRQQRLGHMHDAKLSPYFARCDVAIDGEPERRSLYFGKFSLPELGIYSWATPAARIRFNDPGIFSYVSETDKQVTGTMTRIDQYLIAQQQIRFMTTATSETPRTLVYQEKFTAHKSAFMLPEIVERMEKAQDDIIRADAFGSFLISGPAGSGKTTLALHRIAYLLQAPEHAEQFDPRKILVLVQDKNSKQYFENLLPSLGINDVGISTFDIWAMDLLGIKKGEYVPQYGPTERDRDLFAAGKYRALKHIAVTEHHKDHFALLEQVYDAHLTDELRKLFARQKKEKYLDRIDLTVLLQLQLQSSSVFKVRGRIYTPKKDGNMTSKAGDVDLKYSLILVDEVQNYLAEQISVLKSCIAPETKAMTYVGDLAQQTALFTLRDWSQVGENFADGRAVHLYKVYRSTRQILAYIKSLGFAVDIPDGIREGNDVREYHVSRQETLRTLQNIVEEKKDVLIGIIGLRPEDVHAYRGLTSKQCKVMTAVEAQGLEFDVVVFVHNADAAHSTYDVALREEKRRVVRDQLYVALTRAMNELYVVTEVPLSEFLLPVAPL